MHSSGKLYLQAKKNETKPFKGEGGRRQLHPHAQTDDRRFNTEKRALGFWVLVADLLV